MMMGERRASRVRAMQALFYMDMNRNISDEMFERYCNNFGFPQEKLPFFSKLVKGVIATKSEIDAIIKRFSSNWKMSRMSGVDRNIMRIAVYELLFCDDIPPKVTINEAIDVGKKFGAEASGAFINGILDSVRIELEKKDICVKT